MAEKKKKRVMSAQERGALEMERNAQAMEPTDMVKRNSGGVANARTGQPARTMAPQRNLAAYEDANYNAPVVSEKPPADYGSGLMAEDRYDEQIGIKTTGGAGKEMRTTLSLGDNTVSYAGGPRKLGGSGGGGQMYPNGKTTPRGGGARRLKAGEVLMAPQQQEQSTGVSDLGLISKEKAIEMGLGVNQWRELNKQILTNQGDLAEQGLQNQGLMSLAGERTSRAVTIQGMENQDPVRGLQAKKIQAELDAVPDEKEMFNLQKRYIMNLLNPNSNKKKQTMSPSEVLSTGLIDSVL